MQTNKPSGVLITGASTGIGRATAQYLSSKGFYIYAGFRNSKDLEALSKLDNIQPLQLDVTCSDEISSAVEMIKSKGTGLFSVINNAGIAKAGPLMDLPETDLREQFDVNLMGVHQVTKACFPLLLKSKGRIIMISSDSGFFATPFFGPYCSSKFALEGYSDSLRRELMLVGVKVIIIQPGRVSTPIWDKGEALFDSFKDSIFMNYAKKIGEHAIAKGKTTGLAPIEIARTIYLALTRKQPKIRYLIAPNPFKYRIIKLLSGKSVDRLIYKELSKL